MRQPVIGLKCTAAMVALLLCLGTASAADRPNIVLMISDDHGVDALGSYGNEVVKTPALDQLATAGIRFTRAYGTTSSCSASRSVILTGLHNHTNGQYGLQHEEHHFQSFDDIVSLPAHLSDAGYRTARIGKYHVAPASVYDFDVVLSEGAANDMASVARSPVQMAEMSREFINASDEPFFLYFAMDDPHRALPFATAPEPNRFGNRDQGYPGVTEVVYDPDAVIVPRFLPDLPETRAEIAEYYQSVSRVDQGVGALVQELRKAGKYDNTVIIYMSDNGIAFPGAKTTVYEPGIHLPLIIRAPGGEVDAVSNELVSWVDITPTIVDYAGVDDLAALHGTTIRSAVEGGEIGARDAIFASHSFHEVHMAYPMRMIRTEQYKLIVNVFWQLPYPFASDLMESTTWQAFLKTGREVYGQRPVADFLQRPRFELFDIQADPGETRNLADEAEYEDVLADLIGRIKAFQAATSDPWISKWDYD